MHRLISEIKEMVNKSIREYLPDVPSNDLEENGNIYYMNGRVFPPSQLGWAE